MKASVKHKAFSLIELLVVISVIAMLMSVIGVAASRVRIAAKNMQQAANLHAIEVGLELVEKDYGFYPDSQAIVLDGGNVYGAQQLSEALVGRDMAGVDKNSGFYVPSRELSARTEPTYYDSNEQESLNNRKGPYFNLDREGANVLEVSQIYDDTKDIFCKYDAVSHTIANDYDRAPVIVDNYKMKKVELETGVMVYTGTPILYYRSNPSAKYFREQNTAWSSMTYELCKDSYYNYYDNYDFYELENLRNPEEDTHAFKESNGGKTAFYEYLTSKKVGTYDMPVNKGTFVLISAGYDGIYGTRDDITNFDR